MNRDYSQKIETRQSSVDEKHRVIEGNVDRYQKEEKGAGTVASIAYLGGMGYKGPMEKNTPDKPKGK